jgi:site-specific DNA recombinase
VRAVLSDPARKTSTSSAAVHLPSGIARCGVCGGPMRASMNRTVQSYRCADRSFVSRNRHVDLLLNVRILRTTSAARTFDPDGVAVTWRSS